jgi:hypothetical protein
MTFVTQLARPRFLLALTQGAMRGALRQIFSHFNNHITLPYSYSSENVGTTSLATHCRDPLPRCVIVATYAEEGAISSSGE